MQRLAAICKKMKVQQAALVLQEFDEETASKILLSFQLRKSPKSSRQWNRNARPSYFKMDQEKQTNLKNGEVKIMSQMQTFEFLSTLFRSFRLS